MCLCRNRRFLPTLPNVASKRCNLACSGHTLARFLENGSLQSRGWWWGGDFSQRKIVAQTVLKDKERGLSVSTNVALVCKWESGFAPVQDYLEVSFSSVEETFTDWNCLCAAYSQVSNWRCPAKILNKYQSWVHSEFY